MYYMAVPSARCVPSFETDRRSLRYLAVLLWMVAVQSTAAFAQSSWAPMKQGAAWTSEARADFYSRDQGSRLIPLRWIVALKQADGTPFMTASLARYGYLPNEGSSPAGLPVGFTVANTTSGESLGITCAACHTRQIAVQGKHYRIDGGPAIVDFQSFLSDLDAAVGRLLDTPSAFDDFSHAILGPAPTAVELAALRHDVEDWFLPFNTIMSLGLPGTPWGPGRLDAVSMIFNRLSGLDIGASPDHIIRANIYRADAPVRYPFLWNAPLQDRTQWPGFAANGDDVLGLSRNVGEVTGVFSIFHPKRDAGQFLGFNYTAENSTNFRGLDELEHLVKKIGPPKWPWPLNQALIAQGSKIFAQTCAAGCHEVKPGKFRPLNPLQQTWATPILNVATDTREWSILERQVDPGILAGASILPILGPLKNPDSVKDVLGVSVIGSIIEHTLPIDAPNDLALRMAANGSPLSPQLQSLAAAFRDESAAPRGSYEARVLRGIWAAAPYLHNGSVPTLTELLKPPAERLVAFKIGPAYDLEKVGLAVEQTPISQTLVTTDCTDLNSGNSRCGHDYGTSLSPGQKKALLEYLKWL